MDPLQQQAYAQMLTQMTPTPTQTGYTPQMSGAQALSNGITPLIQALAQAKLSQQLAAQEAQRQQLASMSPVTPGQAFNGSQAVFGAGPNPMQGPAPTAPINYSPDAVFSFSGS